MQPIYRSKLVYSVGWVEVRNPTKPQLIDVGLHYNQYCEGFGNIIVGEGKSKVRKNLECANARMSELIWKSANERITHALSRGLEIRNYFFCFTPQGVGLYPLFSFVM